MRPSAKKRVCAHAWLNCSTMSTSRTPQPSRKPLNRLAHYLTKPPCPIGWSTRSARHTSELSGSDGAVPVAVRSSATAEDTAAASFAGMNETFLNIIDADAVIDAVRHCWRSLFGARTVYYRGSKDLSQADMDIAVVVQRQIQSTRAGVMFTANPATGDRNQLVIEGSFGLGEAVVSGSVSPDRYLVDKAAVSIRSREVHHKELTIVSIPGGGTITRDTLRGGGADAGLDRRGGAHPGEARARD